jgi:hypothetical protein
LKQLLDILSCRGWVRLTRTSGVICCESLANLMRDCARR